MLMVYLCSSAELDTQSLTAAFLLIYFDDQPYNPLIIVLLLHL